jgi:hypothetical protein
MIILEPRVAFYFKLWPPKGQNITILNFKINGMKNEDFPTCNL